MTVLAAARPRRIGGVVALGGLLVVLDTTVVLVAVPQLVAEFGVGLPVVQWVTISYVLALVTVLPAAGWAVGRFGARRVHMTGLTVFVVASGLCAVAGDVGALIGARTLQGLGGGLLGPAGQVIALRAVPRERRGWIMSLLGLPVVVGPLLGPPLAGVLIDLASWRWVFAINLPLGVAAVALGLLVLPPDGPGREVRPLDRVGAALLPPGLALVVLALTLAGEQGRLDAGTAAVLLVGLGLLALFVRRALRVPRPLVALRLLHRRELAVGAAVLFCVGAAYFGAMAVPPVFVQAVRGDTALLTGLLGVPATLATGLTLQVATRLVDRVPAHRIVRAGTMLFLAGTVATALAIGTDAPYALLVAAGVLLGLGSGATIMPTMTVALRDLPGTDTPDGATVLGLVQHGASAVGSAVVAGSLTLALGARGVDGVGGLLALDAAARAARRPELAAATAAAYALPLLLAVGAVGVAVVGLRRR